VREAFEHKGTWWLSDNAEDVHPGTLKFDPATGARLEMTGSFGGAFGTALDVIQGQLINGKSITLCKCLFIHSSINIPGGEETTYFCHLVIEGRCFDSYAAVKFRKLSVSYSNFDQWVNISGFVSRPRVGGNLTIRYQKPRRIKVPVDGSLTVSIDCALNAHIPGDVGGEFRLSEGAQFLLECRAEQHIDYYFNAMLILQGLVSLGVGAAVIPTSVTSSALSKLSPHQRAFFSRRRGFPETTSLFYQPVGGKETIETVNRTHMLFTLADIQSSWDTILRTWFKKYSQLTRPYQLYIGMLYRSTTFIEEKFIGFARAIEGYHRAAMKNNVLDEQEFQQRKALALQSISDKKVKQWVKGKLRDGIANEPSLEQRLRQILKAHSAVVPLDQKSRSEWATAVAQARNDLTHPGNQSGRPLPAPEQLNGWSDQLRFLLECCLMSEVGLDGQFVAQVAERQRMFRGSRWPWP
jgi:ApeA N-terminal domain 1